MSRSNPAPELSQQLAAALHKAHRARGARQVIALPEGLSVSLYIDSEAMAHLLIYKRLTAPTLEEWYRIIRKWPWPTPRRLPRPEAITAGEVLGLRAAWPIRPEL